MDFQLGLANEGHKVLYGYTWRHLEGLEDAFEKDSVHFVSAKGDIPINHHFK